MHCRYNHWQRIKIYIFSLDVGNRISLPVYVLEISSWIKTAVSFFSVMITNTWTIHCYHFICESGKHHLFSNTKISHLHQLGLGDTDQKSHLGNFEKNVQNMWAGCKGYIWPQYTVDLFCKVISDRTDVDGIVLSRIPQWKNTKTGYTAQALTSTKCFKTKNNVTFLYVVLILANLS